MYLLFFQMWKQYVIMGKTDKYRELQMSFKNLIIQLHENN